MKTEKISGNWRHRRGIKASSAKNRRRENRRGEKRRHGVGEKKTESQREAWRKCNRPAKRLAA